MHYALKPALTLASRSRTAALLRGTGSAGFHPGLDRRTGLLLRSGRGTAAGAGGPGPAHQRIFAYVMDEFLDLAPAVARRIFELGADFGNRLAVHAISRGASGDGLACGRVRSCHSHGKQNIASQEGHARQHRA